MKKAEQNLQYMHINFKIGIQSWRKNDLSWKMLMFYANFEANIGK